jgi:hypothetical protein
MKLRGRKLKIDEVEKGGSWEVIYSHLIRIQHTIQEGAAPESSLLSIWAHAQRKLTSKSQFEGAVDIEAAMLLIAPESSITCVNFGNTVINP